MASEYLDKKSAASRRKVLTTALELFSRQGYRATSMRQIAESSGHSVGNLYHHFGGKESIFQALLDEYWRRILDPDLPLNKIFASARFPDDMEEMADAIGDVTRANAPFVMLIYIDVIEFRGKHIKNFYEGMATRFRDAYGETFEERRQRGEFGDVDPMAGVMLAVRWFFYFHTVESCFGAEGHFGMSADKAVEECIRILRYGLLPRGSEEPK